jgi:hypothetical protein
MQFCWKNRYEVMGHENVADAIVTVDLDALWRETRPGESVPGEEDPFGVAEPLLDMCVLPAGHAGQHEFVAPIDVTITFAPAVSG